MPPASTRAGPRFPRTGSALTCVLGVPAGAAATHPASATPPRPRAPGGIGFLNIYASTQAEDGSFGAAALVLELSSAARDARPVIARDGLELFLASNRPGGLGDWDLWVSRRATTLDPWGAPVNVGGSVNTPYFEAAPGLSPDGAMLFFRSTRPGGFGVGDLWMTTRRHESGRRQEPI